MVQTTSDLAIRLTYADACQSSLALKAIEADAKGDYDLYRRMMDIIEGLHWRIASLRCLLLNDGEVVTSESCLNTADVKSVLEWINLACGSGCCECDSVFDDDIPSILI
jgi:hypothetical protein